MSTQPPSAQEDTALRSVHTSNLPEIFKQLNISLAISTYQAGKVILVRADGDSLNTHFRAFSKPMGIAADGVRLTVGGTNTVWYYRNVPDVAPKLPPPGRHDACYLPRRIHVTGDIDIHELAWDNADELWVVNTRFSCLCTVDAEHSFNPRWRPPFVSALAAEDRCHLNGLGMRDGKPKYVTALAQTDSAGGWRAHKAAGGIVMDIEKNACILRGLSMPHSPRWYQDRLWVLESGQGSLAVADIQTGTWNTVAQLPGFTRGLDFYGPLAFIGLSQVRESAVFSGIPLVQRLRERHCGIWVVHIETGQTVGFLQFEAGVQEIFAVQVLPGIGFPELLEWDDPLLAHSYILPDAVLAEVFIPGPEELANSPAYHFQQGAECVRQGNLDAAITAYRECLRLDPHFPSARYDLGVVLGDAGHYQEAEECLQAVLAKEPERIEAYNSLGFIAYRQRRIEQAVSYYEQALNIRADNASAHFNLGLALLLLGDYRRGFAEYEWRWQTGQFTPFQCPHQRWEGQTLPGQTLLIHTEQGAGDAIQFARYIPLAAQRVGKVIVVCSGDLLPLFAMLPGIAEIREPGTIQVAEFDTYLPLLSLPRIFGTTPETIPAQTPYFDLAALKRRKAGNLPVLPPSPQQRKKVGIVWAGSPTHRNDQRRSCPIREFLPLLQMPEIAFYSLQKGERSRELESLPSGVKVYDLESQLHDFGGTALLIEQLDLVISVDTSVVHLAGALGKPVWTLISYVPDWRWGLEGETTPWYPNLRLFRQNREGDWGEVIAHVSEALAEWQTAL